MKMTQEIFTVLDDNNRYCVFQIPIDRLHLAKDLFNWDEDEMRERIIYRWIPDFVKVK